MFAHLVLALLPKSRLLEILRNMEQQNQALEGEANFAYNLVNDSHINNLAKRSIGTSGKSKLLR